MIYFYLFLIFSTCIYSLPLENRAIRLFFHKYQKRDSFTVPFISELDLHELGVYMDIGTPAQQFLLLFDTGSSDTWVPSPDCTPETGCPSFLHRFDSNASSTYEPIDTALDIGYSIGHAKGTFFKDTVAFMDTPGIPYTLGAVDQTTGPISQQKQETHALDGILGASFITALYKTHRIPNPVFSVTFTDVILGDVHTTSQPLVYTNAIDERWAVHVNGFEFQNATISKKFDFTVPNVFGVDTGSNFMYLPTNLAFDLAKTISGNTQKVQDDGLISADCKYMEERAYFKIHMAGNTTLQVKGGDLLAKRETDGLCLFLFMPSNNTMIIGNMLLKHFITVFEFGEIPRIGFSPVNLGDQ